jgi:hypothetical protein
MVETVVTIHKWATETFGSPKRTAVLGKTLEELLEFQRALVAWFEIEDEMRNLRMDRVGKYDPPEEHAKALEEYEKAEITYKKRLYDLRKELGDCFVMLSNCFEGSGAMQFPSLAGEAVRGPLSEGRRSLWVQGLGRINLGLSELLVGIQRWDDIEYWLQATWSHLSWIAVGLRVDVQEVVDEVMVINRDRQWRVDGDGTGKHIG